MTPDDLLNLKRETAEVEQRGVRTRGYQEIHVTGLDRFPASYRTEHTHITQAAPGRGRENLPPSRPKGPEIRRPFLPRWTWHYESFPIHMLLVSSATSPNPRSDHPRRVMPG
jgi:hypothetical protein